MGSGAGTRSQVTRARASLPWLDALVNAPQNGVEGRPHLAQSDTHPHVQRLLDEHYRSMTPAEKAHAVAEAWTVAYTLQSAAIRAERHGIGATEIDDLFARAARARAAGTDR
jgi:hypothetical protein